MKPIHAWTLSGRILMWALAAVAGAASPSAHAQCAPGWQTDLGTPGTNSVIYALAQLPSGDLVAGGFFTGAGGAAAYHIARWNGTSWAPFGSGIGTSTAYVRALAVLPNGDLVAAGRFTAAGGVPANQIARWNGATWAPLGTGLSSIVNVLLVLPNGDLVAGGEFLNAGAATVNHIARWDGTGWRTLGAGVTGGGINALALMPNGDLIAGGGFSVAGNQSARYIARWNGSTWSPLGAGTDLPVNSLQVMPDGNLIAGGQFFSAGGPTAYAYHIAKWDGTTWSPLGLGTSRSVTALALSSRGDLIAGGNFESAGGTQTLGVARWDGLSWTPLGQGVGSAGAVGSPGEVQALLPLANATLAVAGSFTSAGGAPANNVATYDFGGESPSVTGQPMSQTICPGGGASFSVAASGDAPLSYAWQKNSNPIDAVANPSAATDTLVLSHVLPSDIGAYRCVLTNICGSVQSIDAPLTLLPAYARACGGPGCEPDVNLDGNTDQSDIDSLINVIAGGLNPTNIDPDFNHDGNADGGDIDALINVVAGGDCP